MTKGQFLTWTKVVISASLALGSIAPANAQSWTNCPAASPFDTVPDNVPLQQCVDNYDIVALSPGGQGYILDAIDGNPDTGLRIERYGLTPTSSQIPDKVLIKAGSGLTGPMVRMRNDVSIPFEISYITFDGNRFNRPRNSDPNPPCQDR